MAGTILEMRNNYSESVMLGINARKRALSRHDPKKIAASYLDIYQKILPGHH
jgi:glycosyltransferase involved in cell wall biosynthesis